MNTIHNLTVLVTFFVIVHLVLHGLLSQPWHGSVISHIAFTYFAMVSAVTVASVVANSLLSILRGTNVLDGFITYEIE